MAFSVSIDKGPAHLRFVLLSDLKGVKERTMEALREHWPYAKTDFGGGVQRISLLDLIDMDRDKLLAIPEIGPARAEEILRAIEQGKREQFPYRII